MLASVQKYTRSLALKPDRSVNCQSHFKNQLRMDSKEWSDIYVNPSFTKPFGAHTFHQEGGGGGRADPIAISEAVAPIRVHPVAWDEP